MTKNTRDIWPTDPIAVYSDAQGNLGGNATALAGLQPQVDPAAVFSCLQLGAAVPPLSPWKGVRRLMPGFRHHTDGRAEPLPMPEEDAKGGLDDPALIPRIEKLLDDAITAAVGEGPDPVVLFSGGVDSTLLASRLAAQGRRDTLLLNFSFGDADEESQLAEAMASHLGLRFERIAGSREPCACLRDAGQVYASPFADQSTVPMSDLAWAVVSRLKGEKRLIIDGTGADGAFGMAGRIAQWQRVLRLPAILRGAASRVYGAALWSRPGALEHRARILRRSATMPALSAVLAQNPLAGILYRDELSLEVHAALAAWTRGWAGGGFSQEVVASDLALTCANIFVPKALPIFARSALSVSYPFLQPRLVALALAAARRASTKEPKWILKESLSRVVPRNLVYRPKSGFVDPRGNIFYNDAFISILRAAVDGPASALLIAKRLRQACDLLARRATLPAQTLNCLWAIAFVDRWYRTAIVPPTAN